MAREDERNIAVENILRRRLVKQMQHDFAQRIAATAFRFKMWQRRALISQYQKKRQAEIAARRREIYDAFVSTESEQPLLSESARIALLLGPAQRKPATTFLQTLDRITDARKLMAEACKNDVERMRLASTPYDIPALIASSLVAHNPSAQDLFWKLVIVSDGSETARWVRNKCATKNRPGNGVLALYRVALRDVVDEPAQRGFLHVTVTDVDASAALGSESGVYGAQAVIIVAPLLSETSLNQIVSKHTVSARPVLVLASDKSDKVIAARFAQNSLVQVVCIDDGDWLATSDAIGRGIDWMGTKTAEQPIVRLSSLQEFVERNLDEYLQPLLAPFYNRIHNSDGSIAPPPPAPPLHELVPIFNTLIRFTIKLAAAMHSVPMEWPAPQFKHLSLPAADWNSVTTRTKISRSLANCCLPEFDQVHENSDMRQVLTGYLMRMSGAETYKRGDEQIAHVFIGEDMVPLLHELFGLVEGRSLSAIPWHRMFECLVHFVVAGLSRSDVQICEVLSVPSHIERTPLPICPKLGTSLVSLGQMEAQRLTPVRGYDAPIVMDDNAGAGLGFTIFSPPTVKSHLSVYGQTPAGSGKRKVGHEVFSSPKSKLSRVAEERAVAAVVASPQKRTLPSDDTFSPTSKSLRLLDERITETLHDVATERSEHRRMVSMMKRWLEE
eukprot:TRINITY_DN3357_c0_g1_i1.p1 TRINITY_DN3357_c0_g1~~TRINITY_DN3357_c0_g1_i1.p1  ORF type:complete len:761 (+),score=180.64 TRINITY_DN3357_c0_g1_i1:275-2284(+)